MFVCRDVQPVAMYHKEYFNIVFIYLYTIRAFISFLVLQQSELYIQVSHSTLYTVIDNRISSASLPNFVFPYFA